MILDSAASLLAAGGVSAVQMRAVARDVGMTDAGVSHHFGTRDQLLEALLRHGGRRIRSALSDVVELWLESEPDLVELIEALADVYRQGYAELAIALHSSSFRDHSSGLLEPVVDALHELSNRSATEKPQTRLAVAALHQAVALDSIYGSDFRRSAGISRTAAAGSTAQLRWWAANVETGLGSARNKS